MAEAMPLTKQCRRKLFAWLDLYLERQFNGTPRGKAWLFSFSSVVCQFFVSKHLESE
jgi:hypothetical protein